MKPLLSACVALALPTSLAAWFFAPALFAQDSLAYRDAAHYYRPLFEYLRGEWLVGRPPLWNPYENLGVPLVGQGTPSVFYPPTLVFVLPGDFSRAWAVYLVAHVLLAAGGAYALARRLPATRPGAALAAISYAFSGSVLFQATNVVYLVGAAWLPWALLLALYMFDARSLRAAVALGGVQALIILGGDAQLAYHVGLLTAILALTLRHPAKGTGPAAGNPPNGCRRPAALVAVAASVCLLLAAVQILPSVEAAARSPRALYEAPRNLYELAASLVGGADEPPVLPWYDGLLGRTSNGHERQVYQFSVAPWRAVELFWPNVTGRAFPSNGRWLEALGLESGPWDLWTPSLYLGLLPAVLATTAWSVRAASPPAIRYYSWVVLLAAAASLGAYGLVWLARLLSGAELNLGDEVGGAYWWLTVLAPRYVYFRYPAKWLVVAGLGASVLAAHGWDELWRGHRRRVERLLLALAVVSLVGLVAAYFGFGTLRQQAPGAPPDALLGPFDWNAARRDALGGLAQTLLVALALLALLRARSGRVMGSAAPWAAVLLTALDLGAAQHGLLLYAPQAAWRARPAALADLPEAIASGKGRVFRQRALYPPAWAEASAADRFVQCVRWDRDTLMPKHPLGDRIAVVEASQTFPAADFRAVMEVAAAHGKEGLPAESILDLLAARAAVIAPPLADTPPGRRSLDERPVVVPRPSALARAWIVHEVAVLPLFEGRSPSRLRGFTAAALFPGGVPRDWRRVAVVESDEPIEVVQPPPGAAERCAIVYADPLRVEIEVRLASAGLVVLADLDDPGWTLTVEPTRGERSAAAIVKTNRVMRGVPLPAGEHRLVYRYRPRSIHYGALISGLAAVALFAAAVGTVLRSLRDRSIPPGAA